MTGPEERLVRGAEAGIRAYRDLDAALGAADELDHDRYWDIMPLTFGRARLVWTDGYFVDDSW